MACTPGNAGTAVSVLALRDKAERRRFVALEYGLMGAEALFGSAGRDVARCVAFINRRWQQDRDPDAGFIGYSLPLPGRKWWPVRC